MYSVRIRENFKLTSYSGLFGTLPDLIHFEKAFRNVFLKNCQCIKSNKKLSRRSKIHYRFYLPINNTLVCYKVKWNKVKKQNRLNLTLPASCISESCMKIKINLIFIFTFLCGASKGYMKAFKAFIKPFKASQRSVKIKNEVRFFSSFKIGTRRINTHASI